jgi:hypothetical protein
LAARAPRLIDEMADGFAEVFAERIRLVVQHHGKRL